MPSLRSSTIAAPRQRIVSGENGSGRAAVTSSASSMSGLWA
jgi:hypothetical protein